MDWPVMLPGGSAKEYGDDNLLVFRTFCFERFYDESVLKTLEPSFHFWTSSYLNACFCDAFDMLFFLNTLLVRLMMIL